MSLNNQVIKIVSSNVQELAHATAKRFHLDSDEVLKFFNHFLENVESVEEVSENKEEVSEKKKEVSEKTMPTQCMYVNTKGVHKGERCKTMAKKGDFCSSHSRKKSPAVDETKSVISEGISVNTDAVKCVHVFTRGKQKGETCQKPAFDGEHCSAHISKDAKKNVEKVQCAYVFEKGAKQGERCSKTATNSDLCSVHLKKSETSTPTSYSGKKPFPEVKAGKNKISEAVVLDNVDYPVKYDSKTGFVFNEDGDVIGKRDGNSLVKLNDEDVENCVKQGMKYVETYDDVDLDKTISHHETDEDVGDNEDIGEEEYNNSYLHEE